MMCHQDSCAVWKKFHREFVESLQFFPYRSCHSSKIFLIFSRSSFICLNLAASAYTLAAKNLVKSNNKKIKTALELLDELVEYTNNQGDNWTELWAKWQMEKIKKILEE